MRVTFVGPVPPIRGGIAQHAGRLVEALRRAGHQTRVISWRSQYPSLLYKHEQRDPHARPLAGAELSLTWWNPWSWWRAGRAAAGSDLLVFPWVTPFHWLPLRAALAAAGRATPSVAVVHNALPHEPLPLTPWLTRLVMRRVNGVVVHSRRVAQDLERLLAVPRVVCVPHPANLELEPSPLPPRPPLGLLCVGFVRRYKGIETAIEALALLRERGVDARLTVAGEFWEPFEHWAGVVQARGLADRVDLRPGYVSDEGLATLLREHHVLLAPYRAATQSGVVPLAQAAARPVVASAAGGLVEQVREGAGGALAPVDDAPAFADAIERVAADLERQARLARESAASWSEVVDALLEASALALPEGSPA